MNTEKKNKERLEEKDYFLRLLSYGMRKRKKKTWFRVGFGFVSALGIGVKGVRSFGRHLIDLFLFLDVLTELTSLSYFMGVRLFSNVII